MSALSAGASLIALSFHPQFLPDARFEVGRHGRDFLAAGGDGAAGFVSVHVHCA